MRSLRNWMKEMILGNSPNITDKFMQLVDNSHPIAQMVVKDIMEVQLFPWYEAKYGTAMSDRPMRRLVADELHKSLIDVLFVHNDWIHAQEAEDSETPLLERPNVPFYAVRSIDPTYVGDGNYDMTVNLISLTGTRPPVTLFLSQLLCNFRPSRQITHADLRS